MIAINYYPVIFAMNEDGIFKCQHPNMSQDKIEHHDEYQEAVTGILQPIHYEDIDACDDCPAYYSHETEEWHNE